MDRVAEKFANAVIAPPCQYDIPFKLRTHSSGDEELDMIFTRPVKGSDHYILHKGRVLVIIDSEAHPSDLVIHIADPSIMNAADGEIAMLKIVEGLAQQAQYKQLPTQETPQ